MRRIQDFPQALGHIFLRSPASSPGPNLRNHAQAVIQQTRAAVYSCYDDPGLLPFWAADRLRVAPPACCRNTGSIR